MSKIIKISNIQLIISYSINLISTKIYKRPTKNTTKTEFLSSTAENPLPIICNKFKILIFAILQHALYGKYSKTFCIFQLVTPFMPHFMFILKSDLDNGVEFQYLCKQPPPPQKNRKICCAWKDIKKFPFPNYKIFSPLKTTQTFQE